MSMIEGFEEEAKKKKKHTPENGRLSRIKRFRLQPGLDSQSFRKIVTKTMTKGALELPRQFVNDNANKFGLEVTMRGPNKKAMRIKFALYEVKQNAAKSLPPRIAVGRASWKAFFDANGLKPEQEILFSLRAISYFEVEVIGDECKSKLGSKSKCLHELHDHNDNAAAADDDPVLQPGPTCDDSSPCASITTSV